MLRVGKQVQLEPRLRLRARSLLSHLYDATLNFVELLGGFCLRGDEKLGGPFLHSPDRRGHNNSTCRSFYEVDLPKIYRFQRISCSIALKELEDK